MAGIDKSYNALMRHSGDLCAFSVVYRERNLTRAAGVLGISQPSLSKRVQNLEDALKSQLFQRTSRGLDPTRHADRLMESIAGPVSQMAQTLAIHQNRRSEKIVRVSVDFAFASLWLLPRLPRMREDLGDFDIQLLASQTPQLNAESADLAIFLADPRHVSGQALALLPEVVSIVASPGYLENSGPVDSFRSLDRHTLIHLASVGDETPWYDWASWLREISEEPVPVPRDTVFNSYEMVLRYARSGHGLALGWHGLIDTYLDSGELVRAREEAHSSGRAYFILNTPMADNDATDQVRQWIVSECDLRQGDR